MKGYKVTDLSHPVEVGMPTPGALPRTGIWDCCRLEWGDQVNCQALLIAEHAGTNCDAPYHVMDDGETLDQMPVDAFMGPAIRVDMRHVPEKGVITKQELQAWEEKSGISIQQGDIVVLWTGFEDKYWKPKPTVAKVLKQRPSLGLDAAQYLVDKKIAAIGMDAGSPDVTGTDLPVHRLLLGSGVLIIESLANLDQIPDAKFAFIALPLNIKKGSGCPARAVAVTGDLAALARQ